MRLTKKIIFFGFFLVLMAGGGVFYFSSLAKAKFWQTFFTQKQTQAEQATAPREDIYIAFTSEVFDKIKENYWDKIPDDQLSQLYKLATEKLTGQPAPIDPKTKEEVKTLISRVIADYDEKKKREFTAGVNDIVLYNLKPAGRSRLYASKQEKELRNTVENVDPTTDLYAILGLDKNADLKKIEEAYRLKIAELKNDTSPEGTQKLAQINRAYEALSSADKKEKYDKEKIEPTVISKLLSPDVFYIKLTKFSPQSLDEFKKAADSVDPNSKNGPTSLVFDLRANIGGAIDILQYFLGPFIGPDNYAYDFFHQGEKTPYKTKLGWFESLVRYKKVVVLIDGQSQSSAEVMAATLKKYNVGVLVGEPTKGWGTVEQIMALDNQMDENEKFSVFLVHSLTLREDSQPIESRGVDPTINIKDKDWANKLLAHFNSQELVKAVKNLVK